MTPPAGSFPVAEHLSAPSCTADGGRRARSCLFGDEAMIRAVFARGRWERLMALGAFNEEIITIQNFPRHADWLAEVEVLVSTWGMPLLTQHHFACLPRLRAVFYAGGSVRGFCQPILDRNITLVSSWRANAIPVAEFALGQILLANKGYFRNNREYTSPRQGEFKGGGNFGETVALLGAGAVGRKLLALLRPFHLKPIVFDPFLNEAGARALNVEKVSLDEAFARAQVVSNHLADLPETVGLLDGRLFHLMRRNAIFINTGRGATVNESQMLAALQSRPDLSCLLDVTNPEPPADGSPLYWLPNIFLSRHLAGSTGNEIHRMADICIEELSIWSQGGTLRHLVTKEMLISMA